MTEGINITEFKRALLKVVAHVYAQFPSPTTINTDTMSEDGIKWLERSGILQGKTGGGLHNYFLWDATLTRSALSRLQQVEPNSGVSGETLGQLAVRTASGSSDREHGIVADLLGRHLLSI